VRARRARARLAARDYVGPPATLTSYRGIGKGLAILQKAESLGGKRVMGPDKVMESVTMGQILHPEGHLIGPLESISQPERRKEAMPTIIPHLWFDKEAEEAADLYGWSLTRSGLPIGRFRRGR
jgi:hypothetical protein